jgi:hypothetical protein
MKMQTMLLIIIILSPWLVPNISAKSSDIFLDHLTDLMWKDCQGKDIHINQPGVLINVATNEPITLIKGQEYNKNMLRKILEILDNYTYRDYIGPCDSKNGTYGSGEGFVDGCGILTCGNYRLNIDHDGYWWKGVRVDVPYEELFNIASGDNNTQVINKGDGSSISIGNSNIANTGNDNRISQQLNNISVQIAFGAGSILGTIIGIILKMSYDTYRRRR